MNENNKTVYYDCLNEPQCLLSARFYKITKTVRMFGNHADICPSDSKAKMKIHFEEFLKKDVLAVENVAISALNLYKRAVEQRYSGIWLPENHRTVFLPILRRLRNNNRAKPQKLNVLAKKKDSATSPIVLSVENQVANAASTMNGLTPKSLLPLIGISSCMTTVSSVQSDAATSSDMATSAMQPKTTCDQNQSAQTDDGKSVGVSLNESLDKLQKRVNKYAKSISDATPLIDSSFSLSAPAREKHLMKNKVNSCFDRIF